MFTAHFNRLSHLCLMWRQEEDEEAELLAELARIKAERAEEAARKAAEEAAKVSAVEEAALLGGNPLLKEKLQVGLGMDWWKPGAWRSRCYMVLRSLSTLLLVFAAGPERRRLLCNQAFLGRRRGLP